MREIQSPYARTFTSHDAVALATLLRVLADRQRLRIVHLLYREGPLTIKELTEGIGDLSQPTVTHHVHVLQSAGVVRAGKVGTPRELDLGVLTILADVITPAGDR